MKILKETQRLVLAKLLIIILLCGVTPAFALETPPADLIMDKSPVLTGDIIINDKTIEAPRPYIYRAIEGVVMLPLRAVAEELGMEIEWLAEEKSVLIDGTIQIWIDKAYYVQAQAEPTEFGPAPELFNDRAYVPLPFFGYAIKGFEAKLLDGNVVITSIPPEL